MKEIKKQLIELGFVEGAKETVVTLTKDNIKITVVQTSKYDYIVIIFNNKNGRSLPAIPTNRAFVIGEVKDILLFWE
jgi:hypothetical protein